MIKIVFVEADGTRHEVDSSAQTLMQAARDANVPGIPGDCGGVCACGTCHVIVDLAWAAKLPVGNYGERSMLEGLPSISETSRLACQIMLVPDMDGITVHVPAEQY